MAARLIGFLVGFLVWTLIFLALPVVVFYPAYERFASLEMTHGFPLLMILAVVLLPTATHRWLEWLWLLLGWILWGFLQWQTLHGNFWFMQVDTDMKTGAIYLLAGILLVIGFVLMAALTIVVAVVRSMIRES